MERGEDERQGRLGDSTLVPRRSDAFDREPLLRLLQLLQKCLKPLVCSEFFSERL